jgi:hypothetical protein
VAFTYRLPDGTQVTVAEPRRNQFPANLGGAVEYTLVHMVYSILEIMGGALGSWAAGLLIEFLKRVEPQLVRYTRPLIDELLRLQGLPAYVRQFLEMLRSPTGEAGAALLSAVGGSAAGSLANAVLANPLNLIMYQFNRMIPSARPSIEAVLQYGWRYPAFMARCAEVIAELGWDIPYLNMVENALIPRVGEAVHLEAVRRGVEEWAAADDEFAKRGMPERDRQLLQATMHALLGVSDILQAWWRGKIGQEEAKRRIVQLGYTDSDAQMILDTSAVIPGVSDLVTMAVREAWRDEVAQRWGYDEDYPKEFGEWAARQGLSEEWARRYWRAHWELPSPTLGYEMVHRGIITEAELLELLKIQDYPKTWRERMLQACYVPLTRVDVRRMYGLGVLSREDVKKAYRDLGYDDLNAERLTEFTVRYEDRDGESKQEKYREISADFVKRAYKKRFITRGEAETRLMNLRYTHEDVEFMLSIIDAERELERSPDYDAEYVRDMRSLIESAYTKRLLSRQDAIAGLKRIGFSDNECNLLLSVLDVHNADKDKEEKLKIIESAYVSRAISYVDAVAAVGRLGVTGAEQERLFDVWDMMRDTRDRRLTEAQYRMAMQRGIITQEQYVENLRGLGYTEADIDILVKLATGGGGE